MDFILLIALIAVIVYFQGKLSDLEAKIERLETGEDGAAPEVTPTVSQPSQPIPPAALMRETPISKQQGAPEAPSEPSSISKAVTWVKQDFMMKLGAFMLLLALGWFVSYAFANEWIGPAGRIALGIITSVIFLALGTWRIQRYKHQGGIFTVIGVVGMLLTIFAARELYDFFTPVTALTVMFMTVVFAAFLSVRYRSEALAFVSLVLGCLAPLLTNAPVPDLNGLFTYLLVVSVGTLWVVWLTGWTRLTLAALVITYCYSLPFLFMGGLETMVTLTYVFVFVSLFFAANAASLLWHRNDTRYLGTHIITALTTALFLFSWIEMQVSVEWQSLLYTAWALVFALGSYFAYQVSAHRNIFYIYGAVSIALLGIATAAELHGPELVFAYLFEISVLIFAASRLGAGMPLLMKLSSLLIIPVVLSLESIAESAWRTTIWHEHMAVLVIMPSVLAVLGMYLWSLKEQQATAARLARMLGVTLSTGSGVYVVILIWLVSHTLWVADVATMLSLVIYTLAGIGLFVIGQARAVRALRWAGAVLLSLVVLRLLFVEVWHMSIEARIVTFVIIGVLFISTVFIHKHNAPDDTTDVTR